MAEVLWSPQAGPQTVFAQRPEFEVLYGGAKGGGKSDALLMEGLRQIHIPQYRAGFFRRTYKRLQEMIDRSKIYFPRLGGKWNAQDHRWVFPSGARYDFCHIQHEDDVQNYQGQEFHYIAFDQIEEFTEYMYEYILMQARSGHLGIRKYVRCSANPGNIGHAWVKKRWIDGKEPLKRYTKEYYLDTGDLVVLDSCFVPARVYDNPILLQASPIYVAQLMSLPEHLRRAMLEGDWDVFAGQVFSEWQRDTHVVKPFAIPDTWPRFRALDWGYAKPFCVNWFACDPDGNAYCYREMYGCDEDNDDAGIFMDASEVGRRMAEIEHAVNEKISYGVADSSCWSESGQVGPPIIEVINNELAKRGCAAFSVKSDKARIAGKMQVHERLQNAVDGRGDGLFFFEGCVHNIRTIPALVYDSRRVEDVDTTQEDHAYDTVRYFCMSRPVSAKNPEKKLTPEQARIKKHMDNVIKNKDKKRGKRYAH